MDQFTEACESRLAKHVLVKYPTCRIILVINWTSPGDVIIIGFVKLALPDQQLYTTLQRILST